jgi:hypothetical protein
VVNDRLIPPRGAAFFRFPAPNSDGLLHRSHGLVGRYATGDGGSCRPDEPPREPWFHVCFVVASFFCFLELTAGGEGAYIAVIDGGAVLERCGGDAFSSLVDGVPTR